MAIQTLSDHGTEYPVQIEMDGGVYSLLGDCVIKGIGNEFELANKSTASLSVMVKSGQAVIGGHFFKNNGNVDVTLNANATNLIVARIDRSQTPGNTGKILAITEAELKSDNLNNSTGGSRDLVLYKLVTDGSGVTSDSDSRPVNVGYSMAVVEALPENPNANTIYFVKEQ